MNMNDIQDIQKFLKEVIPEKLVVDDIQGGDEPCGNIVAVKDKKRVSDNLVHQLEARLMLIESWINGNKDQLSKNIENVNQNGTSNKKKECEEINQEIKSLVDKIEAEYDVLQLKQKLLLQKMQQYELKSGKCNERKEEKWGKVEGILGPHMPKELSNFEEQLKEKVENAQQMYKTKGSRLETLKIKTCELKTSCEKLLEIFQQKEAECKILKDEHDEKISFGKESFDMSDELMKLYKTFSNVTIEKSGKNFVQVEMTSEIGESKNLLVTLYFKPSDQQGISLDDIHVSNSNLYITDCMENGKGIQNLSACLNSIRERWHYYLNMVEHLRDIQQRLPVDWIQQENKVRVVVGKHANVICTLQLPSAKQSWVSLLDVRGGDSEIKIDLIKPSNPEATLQEWIEYLEQKFS